MPNKQARVRSSLDAISCRDSFDFRLSFDFPLDNARVLPVTHSFAAARAKHSFFSLVFAGWLAAKMPGRTINGIGGSSARKRNRRDADRGEDGDEEEAVAVRESSPRLQSEAVCFKSTFYFLRAQGCLLTLT